MNKFSLLILMLFSINSAALERRDMMDVSMNEITSDTQAQSEAAGDKHLALVWWVPFEYWASVFARDPNVSNAVKEEMLNVLKEYTVVGVVQADISALGSFNFYSKRDILKSLDVSYTANNKQNLALSPKEQVSGDMQLLMQQIGPVLKAAMGNMGANFHFFIYSDLKENGNRLIDPYQNGNVGVKLTRKDGQDLEIEFKTPLNSLFIPRTCPNGEKAHVSWSYCPWSGKKI